MVDVQKLQDMPGYGKANDVLKKDGLWDEYAGLPEREFAVEIEASVKMEDTIIVNARHKNEAEDKASKKFASLHDCDEYDIDRVVVKDSMED